MKLKIVYQITPIIIHVKNFEKIIKYGLYKLYMNIIIYNV